MWTNKHRIGKENKKYKWSYDHSSGYYVDVGFKLILAINQNFEVLGFEIFENSPHDSRLLVSFIEKLSRSRIIRSEDIIVCDKGKRIYTAHPCPHHQLAGSNSFLLSSTWACPASTSMRLKLRFWLGAPFCPYL